MNNISEAELAAYLDKRDERLYNRLLLNRFFQGTVTAVQLGPPTQVQIQRVGEAQADGNWYACAVPGYFPSVGDRVELVWRDNHTAHVFTALTARLGQSSGSARVKIDEQLLVTTASTVRIPAFGVLPQGFRHLTLDAVARGDTTTGAGDSYRTDLQIQFNGDTGPNYTWQTQDDSGTTVATASGTSSATPPIGHVATANATATTPASNRIEILWYSGIVWIKQAMSQSVRMDSGGTGHLRWIAWNSTAAIMWILLKPATGNFVPNSLFTTYADP